LQVITSSQSPILQTFLVLGEQSNLSSVDVLRLSLRSSVVQVRLCALQTLLQRGGAVEIAAILERIDTCDESELQILVAFSKIFLPAVQLGLADRDPIVRQRSLIAISKLEIESQFHQLIRVAQSSDDTQQMVAAEVLLGLAIRYGNAARLRLEPECETRRQQLLSDLWRSVLSFSEHRIVEIVDAWLCAVHWDDPQFQELFQTDHQDVELISAHKITMRQLKHSHRPQVSELLAGILWSRNASVEAIQTLADHTEPTIAVRLSELAVRYGITSPATKNLSMRIPIASLEQVNFADASRTHGQRCALIRLLSSSASSPDIVLRGITELLALGASQVRAACVASQTSVAQA
jgi:hypothetical protein